MFVKVDSENLAMEVFGRVKNAVNPEGRERKTKNRVKNSDNNIFSQENLS